MYRKSARSTSKTEKGYAVGDGIKRSKSDQETSIVREDSNNVGPDACINGIKSRK